MFAISLILRFHLDFIIIILVSICGTSRMTLSSVKTPRGHSELTSSWCGDEAALPGGPAAPCMLHPRRTDMACADGCTERRLPGSAHANLKVGVTPFVIQVWPTPKATPEGSSNSAAGESRKGTRATCLKRNQVQQRATPQPCSTGASKPGLMLTHIFPTLLQTQNPTCKRNPISSLTFFG